MKTQTLALYLLLISLPVIGSAQSINNTLAYKNINSDRYFRLNYENDFFGFTDEYYTQGVTAELVAPWVSSFIFSKALVKPKNWYTRYGLGLEHNGYTPSSISSDAILYNDRPFAATFFLKTFQISIDPAKRQRLSTTMSTGVIGPLAGGGEMQRDIHKWLNNITPHGWDNQIANDAVLNYEIAYEKELLSYKKLFSLSGEGMVRAGTLSDKATVGATLMIGYFDSPFGVSLANRNNFRIYAYEHPQVSLVAYDATMEGGLFNQSSPYKIPAKDVTPAVFDNRFGFVITYQRFYLEYFLQIYSKEFEQGKVHNFGGVQIAFGL